MNTSARTNWSAGPAAEESDRRRRAAFADPVGAPGTGKTTLARVIAAASGAEFAAFSAVTAGIREIKDVIAVADARRHLGRRTIFFVDEIHRFNKAQQDAFLPHIESGTVVLIGATTENPSFEVNSALLSRVEGVCPAATFTRTGRADSSAGIGRYRAGLGGLHIDATDEALTSLARYANGDARVALNLLEQVSATEVTAEHGISTSASWPISSSDARCSTTKRATSTTTSSQRSISRSATARRRRPVLARAHARGRRGPMYIARRLVRFASEDIGNADPRALQLAIAAKDATHFLGMPECNTALAQLVTYLAAAPKSNASTRLRTGGQGRARDEAAPVPLHLRNAPTKLMKDLDYGKDYKYAHDDPDAVTDMSCLPDALAHRRYYAPTERGLEPKLREALERAASDGSSSPQVRGAAFDRRRPGL